VRVNVTAMFSIAQLEWVLDCLERGTPAYVSIFGGRIADAGIDPLPIMMQALDILTECPSVELLWASPRELYNVVQADEIGCHIITVTYDLLKKLPLLGKDLDEFSLETVQMFHRDATSSGFAL
jgi:transaldolase